MDSTSQFNRKTSKTGRLADFLFEAGILDCRFYLNSQ